jgi:oligopeptide transport system permease protein
LLDDFALEPLSPDADISIMFARIVRRLVSLAVVLAGVIALTFVLLRAAPGDPFIGEKSLSPAQIEEKKRQLKLDGPLLHQMGRYFADLARGDMRESSKYRGKQVSDILRQSLPVSFQLGALAFVIAAVGGVVLGVVAALRRNTWADYAAMFTALAAISLPAFITGPLLIAVFALWLGWLPVGGWFSWKAMILPALCLAAPYVAYVARLMRNSLLDVLNQDFIRTARAKGLAPQAVAVRHALRVAILPVVTFLGPLAANLLTGSVIVEAVFGVPGAGQYFVRAIENRDLFLLLGVVLVYCTLLVTLNFLVDLAYTLLDRRIKLDA